MTRMTLCVLVLIGSGPLLAAEPELCGAYPRKIEPDMQIKESDLTTSASLKAAKDLEKNLSSASSDQELATLNRQKTILGYTLRRQALEDVAKFGATSMQAKASTAAVETPYCSAACQTAPLVRSFGSCPECEKTWNGNADDVLNYRNNAWRICRACAIEQRRCVACGGALRS